MQKNITPKRSNRVPHNLGCRISLIALIRVFAIPLFVGSGNRNRPFLTISSKTIKTALTNPVDSLRTEWVEQLMPAYCEEI